MKPPLVDKFKGLFPPQLNCFGIVPTVATDPTTAFWGGEISGCSASGAKWMGKGVGAVMDQEAERALNQQHPTLRGFVQQYTSYGALPKGGWWEEDDVAM